MKSFVTYIINYKDKLSDDEERKKFVTSIPLLCKNIFDDLQSKGSELFAQTKITKTITTTFTNGLKQFIDISNSI